MSGVKVLVAAGFGINCQEEMAAAWKAGGADAEVVHLNELFAGTRSLGEFHVFCIPGGFSFGDDLGSGKVLASRLRFRRMPDGRRFFDDLTGFVGNGGFILGVCNGFQVLVKLGLLPNLGGEYEQEVTLAPNDSGIFEDRWVKLSASPDSPQWIRGLEKLELPIRHGEGKLVVRDSRIMQILAEGSLIPLRYADNRFKPTDSYPANPNGSNLQAAVLIDRTGRILGMMPHPEAFLDEMLHPDWGGRRRRKRRGKASKTADGLLFFKALVARIEAGVAEGQRANPSGNSDSHG